MNGSSTGTEERPPVALVLPGGGARGAYEAGALSILLPALEQRGERVQIICGTSVGAINAACIGATAHLSYREQAEALVARWRSMRKDDVIKPLVGPGLLTTALRFAGDALGIPGVRLASVMDAAPLQDSLDAWIDWGDLARNVRTGVIDSVCVVATSLGRGEPVAFVHSKRAVPPARASDEIHYVRATLAAEHVRASAAIPLLFAPVEVRRPRAAWDYYIDGGTRMNSPLKPALTLGAQRIVIVGFEPFTAAPAPVGPPQPPVIGDVAANVMEGLLYDQVGADLRRLGAINSFFVEGAGGAGSASARAYRTARGRSPYRRIGYALVTPKRRGELGRVAEEVYEQNYGGLKSLLRPDYPLISRFLGGRTRSRGDLLSFLLFDETYVERLITLGARDARRWLKRHPAIWCSDWSHDFDVDPVGVEASREADSLREFRDMRRR
jgi:NTE family protein